MPDQDRSSVLSIQKNSGWPQRGLFYIFLTLCLLAVFTLLVLAQSPSNTLWPDWYVLALPESESPEDLEKALLSLGIEGSVTRESAQVPYMAIPEMSHISVDQIDEALVSSDPRRDSYINALPSLFQSEGWQLAYLPATASLRHYQRALKKAPGFESARFLDSQERCGWVGVLLMAILMSVPLVFQRMKWQAEIFMMTFWAGMAYFIPPVLMVPLGLLGIRIPWKKQNPLWWNGLALMVPMLALFIPAFYGQWMILFAFLLALLSKEWIVFRFVKEESRNPEEMVISSKQSLSCPKWKKSVGRDHALFQPVPLFSPPPSEPFFQVPSRASWGNLAVVLLLIGLLALPVFPGKQQSFSLPAPQSIHGQTREDLEALWTNSSTSSLPNMAQALASYSYQDGFMFGAQYTWPRSENPLLVARYNQDGSALKERYESIQNYDEAWFRETTEELFSQGTGSLLASAGATELVYVPAPVQVNTLSSHALGMSILSLLLSVLLVIFIPPSSQRNWGPRIQVMIARRRAQAA
ncbi:MAG: hypothetical protein MI717_12100 [Spirochaetales bacterium]|nr:hypothetical protein [Spirochaetales bacterium]